ncbi:hypothetical protein L6452_01563 [Arctium lappa]|uniref:Uncharacterized protein n=1 Tax=Arctium lappa TaxID=4217 RepID=A0ACB9FH13_ARCLA|nr:hypothetical protein L6452_01563 [Arctium lappa]
MSGSGVGTVCPLWADCAGQLGTIGPVVWTNGFGFCASQGEGNRSGKFEVHVIVKIIHVGNSGVGLDEIPGDLMVDFGLDLPRGVEVLDFQSKRSSYRFSNSGCMFGKIEYYS